MQTMLRQYVNVAGPAEILGLSRGTIQAWATADRIPIHENPANGYQLFPRRDLARQLPSGSREAVASDTRQATEMNQLNGSVSTT